MLNSFYKKFQINAADPTDPFLSDSDLSSSFLNSQIQLPFNKGGFNITDHTVSGHIAYFSSVVECALSANGGLSLPLHPTLDLELCNSFAFLKDTLLLGPMSN